METCRSFRKRRRLNVGIIVHELIPQTGTSTRALGFVRAITERKHRVMVMSLNGQSKEEAEIVRQLGGEYMHAPIPRLTQGPLESIVRAAELVLGLHRLRKEFNFTLLQFTNLSLNIAIYPVLKTLFNVPILTDLHALGSAVTIESGVKREPLKRLALSTYQQLLLTVSDAILVPTNELGFALQTKRDKRRIYVVPNCVWRKSTEAHTTLNSYERDRGSRILFFSANFHLRRSRQELERVLRIFSSLRARRKEVRVLIAGPGSEKLPVMPQDIVNLGYVDNIYEPLAQSDLVLLPIRDQTLGLHSRVVEAMSAGRPILATPEACCGLSSIDESGIIVCKSTKAMSQTASVLLKRPKLLQSLGKRNEALAKRLFSPKSIGVLLEMAYEATLSDSRSN